MVEVTSRHLGRKGTDLDLVEQLNIYEVSTHSQTHIHTHTHAFTHTHPYKQVCSNRLTSTNSVHILLFLVCYPHIVILDPPPPP